MSAPLQTLFSALKLNVADVNAPSGLMSRTPIDGSRLACIPVATADESASALAEAKQAQIRWRDVPAPRRGELVRRYGNLLRAHKDTLGMLVTLETGKLLQEGMGEVQEMIDICDFAVGLSRQLHGLTIASERPEHRMLETWHPYGICGVISALNFPVAVWAWNAALALVCGNAVIWKPSEKTPLCAWAAHRLLKRALSEFDPGLAGIAHLVLGDRTAGEWLVEHPDVRLISATGSTGMGRAVGEACARQFKRSILELGGNNAAIVTPSANLDLAQRAIVFSAVGTAGQRCTTLRRLIVHESIRDALVVRLEAAYQSLPIGNPLAEGVLVGPLIDSAAFKAMQGALAQARGEGAIVFGGERVSFPTAPDACYVRPAICTMPAQSAVVRRETFAPVLYVLTYDELDQAIHLHNDVPQGLASSIFTSDLVEAERFLSAAGSDCGIANVNIGPSGAEIGGAFGGEKQTGGGREAGSDAWKAYMRRATNTVNYSNALPLAQGVEFGAI